MRTFTCLNCGAEKPTTCYSHRGKFCNKQCEGQYKIKKWFDDNREKFNSSTLTSRAAYKRFILERDGNKCSICNQLPEHNGLLLTMVIDHIDGDASNNNPLNFRLVCPNCDSQLSTYKARNIGKGRATKGMKWCSRL